MVYTYIEERESSLIKKYGVPTTVVVAKVDIQELDAIDGEKLQTIVVPQNFQAPGHFKQIKELENTIATVPILKGEQITKPRVTYPGSKTGLSRQVTVGKRAMAININDSQAVSKLIKPGDRVDVLCTVDYTDGQKDKKEVKTILQDVLVLSTGLSMTNSIPIIGVKTPKIIKRMNLNTYSKYNTVTLELDPYQVQKLVYLIRFENSQIFLTLRNNSDNKKIRINPTKIFDLLGDDAAAAKKFFAEKYAPKVKRGR